MRRKARRRAEKLTKGAHNNEKIRFAWLVDANATHVAGKIKFEVHATGVNSNGVFVELENTVEGFINLSNLPLDNYTFDEKLYTLKGSKHNFMLGQALRVQLDSVNLKDRRIDFTFVS